MPAISWFWQLQADKLGPDWFFFAQFAPADAAALSAAVRRHAPPSFVYSQLRDDICRSHRQPHSYELYSDPHSAPQLQANLAGTTPSNIWIYHLIECCGSDLTIERGYGGYPGGAADQEETDLLIALARAPELTLLQWQVVAGGDGFASESVAQGTDGATLLAYLKAPASPLVSTP